MATTCTAAAWPTSSQAPSGISDTPAADGHNLQLYDSTAHKWTGAPVTAPSTTILPYIVSKSFGSWQDPSIATSFPMTTVSLPDLAKYQKTFSSAITTYFEGILAQINASKAEFYAAYNLATRVFNYAQDNSLTLRITNDGTDGLMDSHRQGLSCIKDVNDTVLSSLIQSIADFTAPANFTIATASEEYNKGVEDVQTLYSSALNMSILAAVSLDTFRSSLLKKGRERPVKAINGINWATGDPGFNPDLWVWGPFWGVGHNEYARSTCSFNSNGVHADLAWSCWGAAPPFTNCDGDTGSTSQDFSYSTANPPIVVDTNPAIPSLIKTVSGWTTAITATFGATINSFTPTVTGRINQQAYFDMMISFELTKYFNVSDRSMLLQVLTISYTDLLPYFSTAFTCKNEVTYTNNDPTKPVQDGKATAANSNNTGDATNNPNTYCNFRLTQEVLNFLPRPLRYYLVSYCKGRATQLYKLQHPNEVALPTTSYVNCLVYDYPDFDSKQKALLDSIAQSFYDLTNSTSTTSTTSTTNPKSIQTIYEALTIGDCVIDVRCDVATHGDPASINAQLATLLTKYETERNNTFMSQQDIDAMDAAYELQKSNLQTLQYKNITNIQTGQILRLFLSYTTGTTAGVDIQSATSSTGIGGSLTPTSTSKRVYTVDGFIQETDPNNPVIALSFNSLYNGGIQVPLGINQGRLNYKPVVKFTKNATNAVWGGPTDPATLKRIMRDYETHIYSDISGEYINLDNNFDPLDTDRVHVESILASADISIPADASTVNPPDLKKSPYTQQVVVKWTQSKYNVATAKKVSGSTRTLVARFAYQLNTQDWDSNEYLFDASGFKFADYVDTATGTNCASDQQTTTCAPSDTNAPLYTGTGPFTFYAVTGPGTATTTLKSSFDHTIYKTYLYPVAGVGGDGISVNLTALPSTITIPRPLPTSNGILDNAAGACTSTATPDVDCSDPGILYKLMDYYNTLTQRDVDTAGAIVSITKAVTPNPSQCDVEVLIDYTQNIPKDANGNQLTTATTPALPASGLRKETRSFLLGLDFSTCLHNVVSVLAPNSGAFVTSETPTLFSPAVYTEMISDKISSAGSFVTQTVTDTLAKAVDVIREYRKETAETSGRLQKLKECSTVVGANSTNDCASTGIMDLFVQKYRLQNTGVYDIGRIIRANTVNNSTCDFVFERNRLLTPSGSTTPIAISKAIVGARAYFSTTGCTITSIKEVLPTSTWQDVQNFSTTAETLFTAGVVTAGHFIQGIGDTKVYWLRHDTFQKSFWKDVASTQSPYYALPYGATAPGPSTIPDGVAWYPFDTITTASFASSFSGGPTASTTGTKSSGAVVSGASERSYLALTTSQNLTINMQSSYPDYTITILCRQNGTTNNKQVLVGSNTTFGYDAGTKDVFCTEPAGFTNPASDTQWDLYTFTRVSMGRQGQGIGTIYRNGKKLYSGRLDVALSSLSINTVSAKASDCQIAEILLYSRPLHLDEIRTVEEYLSTKWLLPAAVVQGFQSGSSSISVSTSPQPNSLFQPPTKPNSKGLFSQILQQGTGLLSNLFAPAKVVEGFSKGIICLPGEYRVSGRSFDYCTPCSAGTSSSIEGATSKDTCTLCSAGTWSSTVGATSCTPCSAGTSSSIVGATSIDTCTSCPAGKYSSPGASSCTSCSAGTWSSTVGATSCQPCPADTYSSTVEATSIATCQSCPGGTYSSPGSLICITPVGTATTVTQSTASLTATTQSNPYAPAITVTPDDTSSIYPGVAWFDASVMNVGKIVYPVSVPSRFSSMDPSYSLHAAYQNTYDAGFSISNGEVGKNYLNSRPVLSLTSNQSLTMRSISPLTNWTFLFLARQTGGANQRVFQGIGVNNVFGYWNDTGNGKKYKLWLANGWIATTDTPSDSNWDLVTITCAASGTNAYTVNMYWNGVQNVTNAAATTAITFDGIAVNAGLYNTESSDCEIAEFMIYNRVVTDAERGQLEGYLKNKWGVSYSTAGVSTTPPTAILAAASETNALQKSGLAWFDASTLSPKSYGTTPTSLPSKFSDTNGFTLTGGTIGTTYLNGHPVLTLTTSQTFSTTMAALNKTSSWCMLFVTRQTGGTKERVFQGTSQKNIFGYGGGEKQSFKLNDSSSFPGSSPDSDTNWDLVAINCTYNSNRNYTVNILWNGTNLTSTTITGRDVTFDGAAINTGNDLGKDSDCELAELIVYKRALTQQELTNQLLYLQSKWGMNETATVYKTPLLEQTGGLLWIDASTIPSSSLSSIPSKFIGSTLTMTGSSLTLATDTSITTGLKVLTIPNTTGGLTMTAYTAATKPTAWTLLYVARQQGTTNGRVLQGVSTDNTFGYYKGYSRVFNKTAIGTNSNAWLNPLGAWTTSDTKWSLVTVQYDGTTMVIYWNGVQILNQAISGYTFDGVAINPIVTGTTRREPSDCQLAELFLYNRVLADTERTTLEEYLQSKWGLGTVAIPDQIAAGAGGVLWIDAASYDAGVTQNTTRVTLNTLPSRFTNGTVRSMTGSARLKQDVLNGLPVLSLNTKTTVASLTKTQSLTTGLFTTALTTWTLAFLARQTGRVNTRVFQGIGKNNVFGYHDNRKQAFYMEDATANHWISPITTTSVVSATQSTTPASDTAWDLVLITCTSTGDMTINWNGVQTPSISMGVPIGCDGIAVNTGKFAAQASDCEIAELIVYNTVLTADQQTQLTTYLQTKWGLTPPNTTVPTDPTTCKDIQGTLVSTTIDRIPLTLLEAIPDGPPFTCALTKPNYQATGSFIYTAALPNKLYWTPSGTSIKYLVLDPTMKCPNGIVPNHARVVVSDTEMDALTLQTTNFSCNLLSRRAVAQGQFVYATTTQYYWIPSNRLVKYTVPSTITTLRDGTSIAGIATKLTADVLNAISPSSGSTETNSETLTFSLNMISLDYIPGASGGITTTTILDTSSEDYYNEEEQPYVAPPKKGILDCAPTVADSTTHFTTLSADTLIKVDTFLQTSDISGVSTWMTDTNYPDIDAQYLGVDISNNELIFKFDDTFLPLASETIGIQMYRELSCSATGNVNDASLTIAGYDLAPSFSYVPEQSSTNTYSKLRFRIYQTRNGNARKVNMNKFQLWNQDFELIEPSTYTVKSGSNQVKYKNFTTITTTDTPVTTLGGTDYYTGWSDVIPSPSTRASSTWSFNMLQITFTGTPPIVYGFSFITSMEFPYTDTTNDYNGSQIGSADCDPVLWKLDGTNDTTNERIWTLLHECMEYPADITTDRVAQTPMFLTVTAGTNIVASPAVQFIPSWYYKNNTGTNGFLHGVTGITNYYELLTHYKEVGFDMGLLGTANDICQFDPVWYYTQNQKTLTNYMNAETTANGLSASLDVENSVDDRAKVRNFYKMSALFDPASFDNCQVWIDGAQSDVLGSSPYSTLTSVSYEVDGSYTGGAATVGGSGNVLNGIKLIQVTTAYTLTTHATFEEYTVVYVDGTTVSIPFINTYVQSIITKADTTATPSVPAVLLNSYYKNGVLVSQDNLSTFTATSLPIGTYAELCIYNTALPRFKQVMLERYLARKWGVMGHLPEVYAPLMPILYPNVAMWFDAAALTSTSSMRSFPSQYPGTGVFTVASGTPSFNSGINTSAYRNTLTNNSSSITTQITSATEYTILFMIWPTATGNNVKINGAKALETFGSTYDGTTTTLKRIGTFSCDGTNRVWNVTSSTGTTRTGTFTGSDALTSLTFTNCWVAEVIVFTQFITRFEQQRMEQYLMQKWGFPYSTAGDILYSGPRFTYTSTPPQQQYGDFRCNWLDNNNFPVTSVAGTTYYSSYAISPAERKCELHLPAGKTQSQIVVRGPITVTPPTETVDGASGQGTVTLPTYIIPSGSVDGLTLWADASTLSVNGNMSNLVNLTGTQWSSISGNGNSSYFNLTGSPSNLYLNPSGLNGLPVLSLRKAISDAAGYPLVPGSIVQQNPQSSTSFTVTFVARLATPSGAIFQGLGQGPQGTTLGTRSLFGYYYSNISKISMKNVAHFDQCTVTNPSSRNVPCPARPTGAPAALTGFLGGTGTDADCSGCLLTGQATRTCVPADTNWDLYTVISDGSYIRFYRYGYLLYTASLNNATFTGLQVNPGSAGPYGLMDSDCDIAEVLLFNTGLTDTKRIGYEMYLAQKWGLFDFYKTIDIYPQPPSPNPINGCSPKSIKGLNMWLDATTLTASTTAITTWPSTTADLGIYMNATGSVTVGASASGGKNVVKLAAGATLTASNNFTTKNFTFLCLAQISNGPTTPTTFTAGTTITFITSNGDANIFGYKQDLMNAQAVGPRSSLPIRWSGKKNALSYGSTSYSSDTTLANSGWSLHTFTGINGSSQALSMANFGTDIPLAIPSNSDTAKISIQNLKFALSPTYGETGEVAEVLLYNRILNKLEIQFLEGYLAWKWGLQDSLATGHPYKTVPPPPNGGSYIGTKDMCPAYSTAGLGVRYLPQPKSFPCPNYIPGGVAWFDMNAFRSLITGAVVSRKVSTNTYVAETIISSMSPNFAETFFVYNNNTTYTETNSVPTSFSLVDNTQDPVTGITLLTGTTNTGTTNTGLSSSNLYVLRVPSTTSLQLSFTRSLHYYLIIYLARWSAAGPSNSGSIFLDNSTDTVRGSTAPGAARVGFTRNSVFGYSSSGTVDVYKMDNSVTGGSPNGGGVKNTGTNTVLTANIGTTVTTNDWTLYAFQYHPDGTCTIRKNGTVLGSSTYNYKTNSSNGDGGLYGFNANLDTQTLRTLNANSLGGSLQGSSFDLAELMIYEDKIATPIKTSDVQRIEGYLAWKWGLQSASTTNFLPTNHMYHATGPPPGAFDPGYCQT